jgi:AcrR family transcriptional regulator
MNAKEKILTEAVKLFAANGFTETGTNEVVRKSGVAKGLLFYHYKSKEGLLRAVIERAWEIISQSCEIEIDEKAPKRSLRILIKQMIRSLEKDYNDRKIYMAVQLNRSLVQKLETEVKDPSEAYYETIIRLFRKMGKKNPQRWALSFDIHFKGVSAGYLMDPGSFPLDEARQMMVDMFTR